MPKKYEFNFLKNKKSYSKKILEVTQFYNYLYESRGSKFILNSIF